MKANVDYLGKYLKRPPIGETCIKHYDGRTVTYLYLDHYTNATEIMTLPERSLLWALVKLSPREVRLLKTENVDDPLCPVKEKCNMCHIGFMIPVNYTNNHGKNVSFLRNKTKNLYSYTVMFRIFDKGFTTTLKFLYIDPDTVMERIFGHGFYQL